MEVSSILNEIEENWLDYKRHVEEMSSDDSKELKFVMISGQLAASMR
jgi:hypothetical protein